MSHAKWFFTRHVDIIRPDQKNYTCGQVNKVAIEEALFGPFEETLQLRDGQVQLPELFVFLSYICYMTLYECLQDWVGMMTSQGTGEPWVVDGWRTWCWRKSQTVANPQRSRVFICCCAACRLAPTCANIGDRHDSNQPTDQRSMRMMFWHQTPRFLGFSNLAGEWCRPLPPIPATFATILLPSQVRLGSRKPFWSCSTRKMPESVATVATVAATVATVTVTGQIRSGAEGRGKGWGRWKLYRSCLVAI